MPVPQAGDWWLARHLDRLVQVEAGGVDLLLIGDSITQNFEKTGPAPDEVFYPAWEEFFAPHHALNLGYSGDQTQNVLWRLRHGEVDGLAPKDVVLLIGTNNTVAKPNGTLEQSAEQVTAGVEAVVDELQERLPESKILLVEILPSGISATKSAKDAAVNAALRARYKASEEVRCLDVSSLFLKDGVLNRSLFYDPRMKTPQEPLHPDTVGQRRLAKAISEALYGPSGTASGKGRGRTAPRHALQSSDAADGAVNPGAV
ncbi:GDSL-type esterase/lipase family protein [Granulicella sp. dw_53]|uniref:GDSL-type esterase/lipase family protein n=1 Tax=Granulicella sp. dw_53 TaxID=2719792 RepID=UPI001BD5D98B|nr:GDSL-type esterase/lipase family protein [Granulicella sp. dw_53]